MISMLLYPFLVFGNDIAKSMDMLCLGFVGVNVLFSPGGGSGGLLRFAWHCRHSFLILPASCFALDLLLLSLH